jgi:hypothetical protein
MQRSSDNIRIVAYNFLCGGSRRRSGHWARLARSLDPELVLAQECREPADAPDERFRPTRSDALLWEPIAGRSWGSGLLSRASALTPLTVPDFGGWVVGAELPSSRLANGRPLRVFSVHVPVGAHGYVRTVHEILDRIAPLGAGADLVLGGDFNVAVGYRLAREKRRISRGEIVLLGRLSNELGLASCWQAAHPDRPLAQTLRWTADRLTPYHCDGIFVPASWLPRLVSCRVVRGSRWDTLSDHNPVVAEFARFPEAEAR